MTSISATWTAPLEGQCVATGSGGHSVVMDAPRGRTIWSGFKPSELLLAALLGCAGMDFLVIILAKQRRHVTSVSATATGEQDADPPWAYRSIDVVYTIEGENLQQPAVDRALSLAVERYCSVGASLAGTVAITHHAVIISSARQTATAA